MTKSIDIPITDEESSAFEELCERNGIDMTKSTANRFSIKKLEMFFDGFPKLVGLQYFPFLSELAIIGQNVSRIENLNGLNHLKELWLSDCKISVIDGLNDVVNLERLYLHGNRIKKIDNLQNLRMLKVLWLSRNSITVVENLSLLVHLTELNLAENRIATIGHALDMNTHLEILNLSGNLISSFKELVNLSRLHHLKSLSLRDPTYRAAPLAENVNYSTQVMFYLPNLEFLDSNEIKSKIMQDIANTTVMKKKSFYDMRLNGVERAIDAVIIKLSRSYNSVVSQIKKNMALLSLGKKELMCYMQHDGTAKLTENGENFTHDRERVIACRPCEVSVSFSVDAESALSGAVATAAHLDSLCQTKLAQIDSAILRTQQTLADLGASKSEIAMELDRISRLWRTFLRIELETAGNVFFDFGTEKDPWFNYCRQLVSSRFCSADFANLAITQVNVLGVVRISNRHQRTQFDLKLESAIVDKHENLWQLTMLEIARRANIEYLFFMPDEESGTPRSRSRPNTEDMIAEFSDFLLAIEHGFGYFQTDQKNGITLTNNLFWADRHRLPTARTFGLSPNLDGRLRFGQALLCKTFCGHCQAAEPGSNCITADMVPNADSVVRPCPVPTMFEQSARNSYSCPECSRRIQEWYVFDQDRVLPEYIVFYQYESGRFQHNSFTGFVEMAHANSQNASSLSSTTVTNAFAVDSDADTVASEPVFSLKTPLSGDEMFGKIATQPYSEKITRLCLYNCSLTQMPALKYFPNLSSLDVSNNRISSFPELRDLGSAVSSLEHLHISFNEFSTFENMPLLGRLKSFDMSWNKLTDLNLILGQLRRQLPYITEISGQYNPWFRPKSLRARFIAAFKNLKMIDDVAVTEEERTVASRLVSSASLANAETTIPLLMNHARTDYVLPHVFALGPNCHQILHASHSKPKPYSDPLNHTWMENITTLVLEGQGLTKLVGIDRLKGLKWASLCDNFITSLHGIDSCHSIVELLLDNNCVTNAELLCGLSHMATLSLNNNRLTNLEWSAPEKLQALSLLSVNGNIITSPNGAQNLPALQHLYLANNSIDNIRETFLLKNVENLFALDLYGNAVCSVPNYRLSVIYHLPHLKILDSLPIEYAESNAARDCFGGKFSEDFVLDRLGLGPGADLSRITELDLPSCNLYTIEINPNSLPNLRSVNLENNNLSHIGTLAVSTSLHVLCLNNNHIETMLPPIKGRQAAFGPKSKVDSGLSSQSFPNLLDADANSPILVNLEVLYLAGNGIRSMSALQLNRIPSLVTVFLQNNELSSVEGIDCLINLRDLVLDRNRIKSLHENSFVGQGRLVELHLEENRLRDLSFFSHLRNLRRLYLGGNKLQMASELERLQDLRKVHEISLVNNPLTRKNIHRAVILYYLPQLHLIDGMPVSEEDTAKAQMLANQEDPQSAVMGAAALMPTTMTNYLCTPVSPNSGILPVHVYQPIGLPPAQPTLTTAGPQSGSFASPANTLVFYQTGYHHSQQQISQAQQQAVLSGYVMQQSSSNAQQQSSNPQIKISNLQLGLAKPSTEDSPQSSAMPSGSLQPGAQNPGSAAMLNPVPSDAWNVRRLRVNPAAPTILQQMNAKQLFMPPDPLGTASSQQQQDAVAK